MSHAFLVSVSNSITQKLVSARQLVRDERGDAQAR
jgi:hypothetical protein